MALINIPTGWSNLPAWILRHRLGVLLLSLLAVLAAGSGVRFLHFSNNYRGFFSKENPDLLAFDAMQNTYTKDDNLVLIVAPRDGSVFTRKTLDGIQWLTRESWRLPFASRVDSLTNFQYSSASGDDLHVRDLVEEASSLNDEQIGQVRKIALSEPMLRNLIVSDRGHVAGVNVTFVFPEKRLEEVLEAAEAARALASRLRQRDRNLEVRLAGTVMINTAYAEYGQKDFATLVPLMYGIVLLATFFILRSLIGALATALAIGVSIVAALGLAGWLGLSLSPTSVAAPTIIMTIAVADSIHLLLSVFHGMGNGLGRNAAIAESLQLNLRALFITAIDTVIGFLTLNFSDVPPYRDLGNMVALGVSVAFLFTVFTLPALLSFSPLRYKASPLVGEIALGRFTDFVIRRRRRLLWATAAVALGLLAFVPRNEFYDDFNRYFDPRTEVRQDTDFMAANLTGTYWIFYSVGAGSSGGVTDPRYLKKLDEFTEWYRRQPGVAHVYSITDVIKRINKNMHGDDPAYYRIPEDKEMAAQQLLLYELSLPLGLDLNDRINVDRSATRITASLRSPHGLESPNAKEVIALENSVQAWLRENAPEHMRAPGTGPGIMFPRIGIRNTKSMISGDVMGVIAISVVMIIALKSLRFGLITMIPNLLPAAMTFGIWGLLVGRLGMDAAPVTGMTLGILVDDTTHNMIKYLYARRKRGMSPAEAVRYTFATVGKATLATSAVLVLGFSVLALSLFKFNSTMGLLTAITIAIGALTEFFLMGPLLLRLEEKELGNPAPSISGAIASPATADASYS